MARPPQETTFDGRRPGAGREAAKAVRWLRGRAAPAGRAWRLARFEARVARATRSGRPIAVVIGNCQAPPVHDLLADSPAFAGEYELVPVPPIHAITAAEVRTLRRLLARTELIVGQPISADYRGLGLGLEQLVAHAPPGCRTIRWASMYWSALFPYCVYVHTAPRMYVGAPIVEYHDVRFLACAAAGMDTVASRALLREHTVPPGGLAAVEEDMLARYGGADRLCDISMLDWIRRPENEAAAFWTINHPTRITLEELARRVHEQLGLPFASTDGPEPLGALIAPIDAATLAGRPGEPRHDWVLNGRVIPQDKLLDIHLAWYRKRPDVVAAGVVEHAARRAQLGLP